MKKPYQAPRIVVHGDIRDVTRANLVGTKFDGNFVYGQLIPPNIAMS